MDIGKVSSNLLNGYTNSAVNSVTQASDDSFARRLEAAAQNNDDKELKAVCQEFEAIMLDMLYKQMKATVIKSDLIEKDPGTDIFESMQDEELMKKASQTGSLGLAESLYKQLSRQYGKAVTATVKSDEVQTEMAQEAQAETRTEAVQESEPGSEENGE